MSSHFHQEFPSLQAAGEAEKGDGQEEEPYGPGPSLRPQSMDTLMHVDMEKVAQVSTCERVFGLFVPSQHILTNT